MSIKQKLNYENQEDLLEMWLETESDFKPTRRQAYRIYLQKLAQKYPQFNNPTTQLIMTYTQFVNLITKNAVIATVLMVLALGSASVAAAELFAPAEFKPSKVLNVNQPKETPVEVKEVTDFEECKAAGGNVLQTLVPPIGCEYDGKTFFEKITVEPTDPTKPEPNYVLCERINPSISSTIQADWTCKPTSEYEVGDNIYGYVVEAPRFTLSISNGGTGICEMNPNCKATQFIKTDYCSIQKITGMEEGSDRFIYWGSCKIAGQTAATIVSPKDGFTTADETIVKQLLSSLKVESGTTTQTYLNDKQNLSLSYNSDWQIKTEQDDQYSELVKTISLTKEGLTLRYTFMNVYGTGFYDRQCTNNDNLFLSVNNGYYRIRLNNGSRMYVTGQENFSYDKSAANFGNGLSDVDIAKSSSQYISALVSNGQDGTFKFCSNPVVKSTQSDIVLTGDYPPNDNKVYTVLNKITVEGPNSQDRNLLAEADKIVASTKLE